MIPEKKKTAEEIASLRGGLGIPVPKSEPIPPAEPQAPAAQPTEKEEPLPAPAPTEEGEPVIHLEPLPLPARIEKAEPKPAHSLRKHDLPLAPPPAVTTHRTELPTHRHDPRDVAQIRKREALAALRQPGTDPVAHLRKQTASPFLYVFSYVLAIAAGVTIYQRAHYITPSVLLALAAAILIFIAVRKPRSRHHAALLFILVFLTLVFGALHYAPLFQNGP